MQNRNDLKSPHERQFKGSLGVLRVQPGFRALREGSLSGFGILRNFSQVSCQLVPALLVQFVQVVHFAVQVEDP